MKSIAVIGLGQFGYQVAISLSQKGYEVVALDSTAELVDEIKDLVAQAVCLDTTDEKAMRSINIDNVDIAIVAIGANIQSSLMSTALLQRLGVQEVHVRYINSLQESILKSMAIKNIISIEKEMGQQVANIFASEGIGRYITISDRHALLELRVPKPLVNKTLKDLNIRAQYGVNIVGIKVSEPEVNDDGDVVYVHNMTDVPDPAYPLGVDDALIVSGTDDNLNRFIQLGRDHD